MEPAPPQSHAGGHEPVLPAPPPGFTVSLLRYLEARGVLLTLEAQDALQQVIRLVMLALFGGIAAFGGWLLLNAACAAYLVQWTDWSWAKAIAVVGGSNLLVAFLLFAGMARMVSSSRWFADSITELQKDRTWLAQQKEKL